MIYSKIKGIKTIIRKGLSVMKNPYMSCSWGKDSIVLLYFLLQFKKNIKVVYLNSGYTFPEIYQFRDKIVKDWDINYIELKNNIDYYSLCKEIGLPHVRSNYLQNNVVKKIKKNQLLEYAKEHNHEGVFWGIRADESKKRKNLIRFKGTCFQDKERIYKCSPLAYISNFELWMIIDFLRIPYCDLYTKNKFFSREKLRNFGWLSTDGAWKGSIEHIKFYYPDLFRILKENFNIKDYL